MQDVSSDKFASMIARVLDDKQAKDIKILNISNISVLADYFVICSSDKEIFIDSKSLLNFVVSYVIKISNYFLFSK